ncbi:Bacterial extracellular solute-binding protein, family 7 [Pigmentiphaga humi]|uniref:Bacterial extracellular solute-binding protein, family 7 n=1 Tax=Pigmentiphaga humi TaxID=2478468 RepID=A0A3P4B2B2_9BURK|nr:TRAP transporter substrate-binding protein DctP [Pigmentiphaga humi]VCU70413.1 Bacterial extracellular solute-binding protein, family 7 [Pigmentiphaga humi]
MIDWKHLAAAVAACLATAAQAQTKELIYNSYLPPFDPVHRIAVVDFAKRIEAETGGTLKITIPASSLAPSPRQWDIVSQKVADLAVVAHYSQRSRLQLPLIADLPFNAANAESASVALWNVQQKYFDQANEFKGMKLLSMHTLPPRHLVSSDKEVKTIEDFRALKVWTPAGELTDIVRGLGGVAVYSTLAQLYEYASKHTVDAFMVGPGTIAQQKVGDYVKYMMEVPGGFGTVSFAVVMNGDTWNGLSDAQRAAVQRAAEGLPQRTGRAIDERERDGMKAIKLQVSQASADILAKMEPVMRTQEYEWVESARKRGVANPEQVLKAYREEMAKAAEAAGAHER